MSPAIRLAAILAVASSLAAVADAQTPQPAPTLAPSSVPAARGSGVPYKVRVNVGGTTLERLLASPSPSPRPKRTAKPTPRPSGAVPPYDDFGTLKSDR